MAKIADMETFDLLQEKLSHNRKLALRNNESHHYLLRTLVTCGTCKQGSNARTTRDGRSYYICRGHHEIFAEQRCRARHVPAGQLDELVWQDLCEVSSHPEHKMWLYAGPFGTGEVCLSCSSHAR